MTVLTLEVCNKSDNIIIVTQKYLFLNKVLLVKLSEF